MTFSVEIADVTDLSSSDHSVEIYIDKVSLESLVKRLSNLCEEKIGEHMHLMTESWGLGDLTENLQGDNNQLVHHLKIVLAE